ncbi:MULTISPECIES: phosphosulfolactate synthase [Hymenobacter]|uniref:Phosphosulfolactate synthase n=2 Tax=Hymenobacter TaxID=89966 RepID=A0ABS6X4F7_9BACT|nr:MULTISPECIES: phosphosulfolactate synthase [Hymenobacter]MBO3269888.1 phosphosulfolactate synthase [Hymenobacter defluvii]MBW3130352.1 phosphosulfolactate synthase [Hymenobacter profundi]QNE40762.1 phosphosulfolactate synthase [Hymenobacter sp. NBH84]
MNYHLDQLPERTEKPREQGYTMVMDKGLSVRETEDFLEVGAPYADIVKLGWATSFVTPNLKRKLAVYKEAGIPVYFGGTLFEAFIIRNQFDDYRRLLAEFDMEYAEVSDGSLDMPHDKKCEYIRTLSKEVKVLSEVGSKDAEKIIPPYKWISQMQTELEAGSIKVIGEAREAGNVGLFRSTGEVRSGLVEEILTKVPVEKILWEAPQKAQQVWFIKLLGANVNLGNIAPNEIVSLETIRLGLRGDTFTHFLDMDNVDEMFKPAKPTGRPGTSMPRG